VGVHVHPVYPLATPMIFPNLRWHCSRHCPSDFICVTSSFLCNPSFTPTYKAYHYHYRNTEPFHPMIGFFTPMRPPGQGVRGCSAPAQSVINDFEWHREFDVFSAASLCCNDIFRPSRQVQFLTSDTDVMRRNCTAIIVLHWCVLSSIYFVIFCFFLLFPFFHWLYLFSSFVHPFPFYQNSLTPFPGQRSWEATEPGFSSLCLCYLYSLV